MAITLNKRVARKVLSVVDNGLVKGMGIAKPGKMCIEAAVCYALGLEHSDNPPCVGSAVRAFKIALSDANWPSDKDRTKGMRELAIAQLGSNEIDQQKFAEIIVIETVKQIIPNLFKEMGIKGAEGCRTVKTLLEARDQASIARNAAYDAANAADAAYYAAYVAYDAADAATAAYAAYDAVYYAADAAYATAADAALSANAAAYAAVNATKYIANITNLKSIKYLLLSARIGLKALKTLKSPGCKWLDICR